MPDPGKPRILLSEGSTLSARQTVTVLDRAGHRVDVCDPDPRCISSWSRYVRGVFRCPGMGEDPAGYLAFMIERLERGGYDVLLPVHEQAYLFARFRDRLPARVHVALAPFAAFERVQSKAAFSLLLGELGLSQPATTIVHDASTFLRACVPPVFVKMAFGTASGAVWRIGAAADRDALAARLTAADAWPEGVLVQQPKAGLLERTQALFDNGRLLAWHAYRQELAGVGGGDVIKVSCPRPLVGEHLARIGRALGWHGPFALDYLWDEPSGTPFYFDCNPRLVEPVNASLCGVDLPGICVRLALGERVDPLPAGRSGVRTRMGLMGLMQRVADEGKRASLFAEAGRLLLRSGVYAGTVEELLPVHEDPLSLVPMAFVSARLLAKPGDIEGLRSKAASRHTLSPTAVRFIRAG